MGHHRLHFRMARARVPVTADQVKGFILTPRLDLPVHVRFIWISSVEEIITSGIQCSIFSHVDQPITIAFRQVHAWNRETRYFKSCFPMVVSKLHHSLVTVLQTVHPAQFTLAV